MTTLNPQGLTSSELHLSQLLDSYIRLGTLLQAGVAPIIEMEVAMLVYRTVALYGPGVMTKIGEHLARVARREAGFCDACKGEPNYVGFVAGELPPLCRECDALAQAEFGLAEVSVQ